jgi:hypothetical protein
MADDAAKMPADDLDLVQELADDVKDDSEIWSEITAQRNGDDPAPEQDAEPEQNAGPDTEPEEQDTKADGAQPAAKPNDIWASATPEQLQELERLRHAKTSADGRVAAFQRRYEQLKANAQQKPQGQQPIRSVRDELKPITDDYPEIAAPLTKVLANYEGQLASLMAADNSRRTAEQQELVEYVNSQTSSLRSRIPDYDQFLGQNIEAFKVWVEDQPKAVREAAYRNGEVIINADEAYDVISLFSKHLAAGQKPQAAGSAQPNPQFQQLDDRRRRQLSGTASPQSSSRGPTPSGIPSEGDSGAIWDAIVKKREKDKAALRA